jgi:hypothetical protein
MERAGTSARMLVLQLKQRWENAQPFVVLVEVNAVWLQNDHILLYTFSHVDKLNICLGAWDSWILTSFHT